MIDDLERIVFVPVVHTDTESVANSRNIVQKVKPSVVAVELDKNRYEQLTRIRESDEQPIPVSPPSGDMITNLMNQIALLEQSLGTMTGSIAGMEMLSAIEAGRSIDAKIALIDRPIEMTTRALMQIPLDEIYRLMGMIPGATQEVEEGSIDDIMQLLKSTEGVQDMMENFRSEFPSIARVLIDERDLYIAKAIKSILGDVDGKIVVVLGAGHLEGVKKHISEMLQESDP